MYDDFVAYDFLSEKKMKFSADVTQKSPELNMKMRSILVVWLWQVNSEFKYKFATGWSAIEIVDRYLMATPNVRRKSLQCHGLAALLIAAKFQETMTVPLSEHLYIADNCCSLHDLLQTELKMLSALNFDVNLRIPVPLADFFGAAVVFTTQQSNRVDVDTELFRIRGALRKSEPDLFSCPHVGPGLRKILRRAH